MRTMVGVTMGLVISLCITIHLDFKKANEVIKHDEILTNIIAEQLEYEKSITK